MMLQRSQRLSMAAVLEWHKYDNSCTITTVLDIATAAPLQRTQWFSSKNPPANVI